MNLSLLTLGLAGVAYLLVLFLVATLVDRGRFPQIARHPLTAALGLGVYASSWSFYGSVGFARIAVTACARMRCAASVSE